MTVGLLAGASLTAAAVDVDLDGRSIAALALIPVLTAGYGTFYAGQ